MLFLLTKSTILIQENLGNTPFWQLTGPFQLKIIQAVDCKDFPFSDLKMFGVWIHLKTKPVAQGMV